MIFLIITMWCAAPLLLSGCGDDDPTGPARTAFSYKLTVIDDQGDPLPGLRISRACLVEPVVQPAGSIHHGMRRTEKDEAPGFVLLPARPNPGAEHASIMLEVMEPAVNRDLAVVIRDWRYDTAIASFQANIDLVSGVTLVWAIRDDDQNPVPDGVYSTLFTVTQRDSALVLFEDEVWFSVATIRDPYRQAIGETDADGVFVTTDKGLFPQLQGHQPQVSCDDGGVPGELFRFSDTVAVTVRAEPAPGSGGMAYWMTQDVVIGGAQVESEWVFVPDDSALVSVPEQSVLPVGEPFRVILTR